MPTYAYMCDSCGNEVEVFQKMADDPLTECESCGGGLKKRMFPVGIVFKGSGFYVNDYGKKDGGTSSTSAASSSTSETKAEAKPETTAETKVEAPAATPAKADAPTSQAATPA